MYLTAVFVILFQISLGFHLNFGLAQLLHDLSRGNAQILNIGNSKESKPTQSSEPVKVETGFNSSISKNSGASGSLKTSVSANSSDLEDSLKGVFGKATKALDDVLETVETVGGKTGKVLKDGILEGSLETVSEIQGEALDSSFLESSVGTISDKVGKVLEENESGGTLKSTAENVGKVLQVDALKDSVENISENAKETIDLDIVKDSGKSLIAKTGKGSSGNVLEGVLDNVSGKVGKTANSSNLQSSLKSLQEKARNLEGSLDIPSGETGKAVAASILEDSLKNPPVKVGKVSSSNVLEGTLKTASGELGKAADAGTLGDAVKSLSGKGSKVLQDSESVSGKIGKTVDAGVLEDAVKTLPDKASAVKTLSDKVGGTTQSISEIISGKVDKTLDADKIIPSGDLVGSLEIGFEEKSKSLSSGILKDSVKGLQKKAGKSLQGALDGSLDTVSAEAGKTIGGGVVAGSLETISENPQKGSQGSLLDIYEGTAADLAGEPLRGISLEDSLGKVTDRVKKALNGSTSVKAQAIESIGGSSKKGVSEKVTEISPNLDINTEVSIGCVATSLANVPAISKFIKTCHKAVLSSKLLIILFNITDATALQLSQFKYRHFADIFRKLGFIDANEIATLAVRHIAKYFEVISTEVFVKVYTSFLAFFLFSEGILVDANAEKLALAWIKAITESSEANDVICDCDFTRKFEATSEGNANFLFSVGEMTKSKAWAMALYYAHAWLLAAVEQGSLRVLSVK